MCEYKEAHSDSNGAHIRVNGGCPTLSLATAAQAKPRWWAKKRISESGARRRGSWGIQDVLHCCPCKSPCSAGHDDQSPTIEGKGGVRAEAPEKGETGGKINEVRN